MLFWQLPIRLRLLADDASLGDVEQCLPYIYLKNGSLKE